MMHELTITPSGHLLLIEPAQASEGLPGLSKEIVAAFAVDAPHGLLHLATSELQASLPPSLEYARSFARRLLTRLCQTHTDESPGDLAPTEPPTSAELGTWILQAPPMIGLEYLTEDALRSWWIDLDHLIHEEIRGYSGGAQAYLSAKNPTWRLVGRVTFHLAENKRDPVHPFAFMATYTNSLSARGSVQHDPLGRALQQYAGAKDRQALLRLLSPIQKAAERSDLVRELVESAEIYQPLRWSPRQAHRFLQEIPLFEECGLIVRLPDWWKAQNRPRPVVSVRVDNRQGGGLGVDALLDFSVKVSLNGETLSADEIRELLASVDGLARLRGTWVEVDREKLTQALEHWQTVERKVRDDGLTFFEGMRLLSGAAIERDAKDSLPESVVEWTGLSAGPALEETLQRLRSPDGQDDADPPNLHASLRPYQRGGLRWLRFVTQLGLGGCLADDMGLGKTVQVIALLLERKRERESGQPAAAANATSLLAVPASLIANWKAELMRFAPSLTFGIAHPSETGGKNVASASSAQGTDLVITTYGMLGRLEWLRSRKWDLLILDEAQAIKNAGTRQARAVKEMQASARLALTGTPVENRLGDLWSLFDFLNPGLLGSAKSFSSFIKRLEASETPSYGPLRKLVQPYILRRLKTDKRVISDLPEKTEIDAYCGLTKRQAALYEQSVRDLREKLESAEGIQRRGMVLAQLLRLKQICNHPTQMIGQGEYDPEQSSKFLRLAELCEELAQRQEKALIFTQFREMAEPLARFLQTVFGRQGLILHGGTPIAKRRKLVEDFQREGGPPFFVLSLKAGGTGLNLTAASQVIHFDRWWNPAVEDQATDRAFRIGQKRNVLVHKFICRGTVEEKIDELIKQKTDLARNVVEGGEVLLTEMNNEQLLQFVALDVHKALDS
jgi:non-specific serine/threonine protein kinase